MLPKWESKLGGAAGFMLTHCFSMAELGELNLQFKYYFKIVLLSTNN
jgi:hypothetical protein